MDLSTPLFFLLTTLFLVQHSHVCEANWFTDLMARFGNSDNTQAHRDAHATVYGNGEDNYQQDALAPRQPARSGGKNTHSWTHELIAAAAGFEAMRVYERHQARQTGQPPNHSIVKGILAGLAAAAVDRLIETRGMDWLDAQRAKQAAASHAENMVDEYQRSHRGGNGRGNGRGNDRGQENRNRNNDNDGQDERALAYGTRPAGNNDEY